MWEVHCNLQIIRKYEVPDNLKVIYVFRIHENQDDGNNKVPTIPSKVDAFLRKNNYSDSFFEPCRLIIRGQPFLQKDNDISCGIIE